MGAYPSVYELKWKGVETGWDYKLQVYAAGTELLGDDLENLMKYDIPPIACVVEDLDSAGFEKFPLGVQGCRTMKVFWDLNKLPSDSWFDELREALLNPVIELNKEEENLPTQYYNLQLGTVYILYVNNVAIFKGIQTEGIEADFDFALNELKLEIEDLWYKTCTQCRYSPDFWNLFTDEPLFRHAVFEYYEETDEDEWHFGVGHYELNSDTDYHYYFASLEKFWTKLTALLSNAYSCLLRIDTELELIKPLTKYYRQKYDASGDYGTELTWNEINILYLLARYTNFAYHSEYGGLLVETYYNHRDNPLSLHKRYPDSVWDFLCDFYKESLTKILFDFDLNTLIAVPIYCNSNVQGLSLDKCGEIKPKIKSGFINKVTSSLIERYNSDIDKHEADNAGPRNKVELNLPIVFNNLPMACGYEETYNNNQNHFRLDDPSFIMHNGNGGAYYISNLYYFHQATGMQTPMPIRVSEFCRTKIQDTPDIYTDEILAIPSYPCDGSYTREIPMPPPTPSMYKMDITQYFQKIQSASGKPFIQSETLLKILGDKSISEVEIEMPFFKWENAAGYAVKVAYPWFECTNYRFQLDLSDIYANLSYVSPFWYWMKSKLDIQKEIAIVTLQSQGKIT